MILVDSNVLLDIIQQDPVWAPWSTGALEKALMQEEVGINQLIYAELSILYDSAASLDRILDRLGIGRYDLPWEGAHKAGQAFIQYRRRGGSKSSPMPDFYIGAHAQVVGLSLLTRDARRYRTYFPEVTLITPEDR